MMKYKNTINDDKIECKICPRHCKLKIGQSGFCKVRKNIDDKIVLTAYGHPLGLNLDPIEKKPLYHFYPDSEVFSFGTFGCNMGCLFCQNYHMTKIKEDISPMIEYISPKEIAKITYDKKAKGVAFTYNDPIIFLEYAIDIAKQVKKLGLKNIAVTSGYMEDKPREEFFKYIDACNIDLKGFSNKFYKKLCLASIEPVLETIKYVKNETNCHMEITTLLIEGENDSNKEIENQCQWILDNIGPSIPLHFSAFFPMYKLTKINPTTLDTIKRAYNIAKDIGLNYVYAGNVQDEYMSTTFCHNCKKPIIKRDKYRVKSYNINYNSNCAFCDTPIYGSFDAY